jgi:hypothetical protein
MEETQTQTQLKVNHSVRIAILSTGERILCLFGDVKDDQKRTIGYKVIYPFALGLGDKDENGNLPIRYSKWCPYTPVQEFRINGEHIISVTYPDNAILENYVSELEEYGLTKDQIFYPEESNGDNSEPAEVSE